MSELGPGQGLVVEPWWRVPSGVVQPLYESEIERWGRVLDWDTDANWREVERGRRSRGVPGVVARDPSGGIVGWAFYVVHDRALQIGGFVSPSVACTDLMLDAILAARTSDVDTVTCFALGDVPGLVTGLRRWDLSVGRYWYLARTLPLPGITEPLRSTRLWRPDDVPATAALLARAYGPSDGSRPFAPRHRDGEWQQYVSQLVTTNGCGTLLPDASLCVPAGPGRVVAAALVSRISPGTGHVVQFAVDPLSQGRGLGRALFRGVCGAAARAGCRRVTLLVDGRNRPARSLYEAEGFEVVESFVAAGSPLQPYPRRSTSVEPDAIAATLR